MITGNDINNQGNLFNTHAFELDLKLIERVAKNLQPYEREKVITWTARNLANQRKYVESHSEDIEQAQESMQSEMNERIQDFSKAIERETRQMMQAPESDYEIAERIAKKVAEYTFMSMSKELFTPLVSKNLAGNPLAQAYNDIIREVSRVAINGTYSLNDAVQKVVVSFSQKGIYTEFVDSGGHKWSLERYANMVARTAFHNTYNEVRTSTMKEENLYTVLVTSHPRSRVACAYCQGKVIDIRPINEADSGYPSAYEFGYGEPAGHRGINCKHLWIPFRPNLNENNQKQYNPGEAIENERIEQKRKSLQRSVKKAVKAVSATDSESEDFKKRQDFLDKRFRILNKYENEHGLKSDYELKEIVKGYL